MTSIASASPGKIVGQTIMNTGRNVTKKMKLSHDINLLVKEKPVSDIIRALSDESISQEDVVASLYSYARRKTDSASEISGQELENVNTLVDSITFALETEAKQIKIGGFEVAMKDVISSPFLPENAFIDTKISEYVVKNLSDFTEDGEEYLLRIWDSKEFFSADTLLWEVIDKSHLTGNPGLLIRWSKWGLQEDKLRNFLLSGDEAFNETVLAACKESADFEKHVRSLRNEKRLIGLIQSTKPREIGNQFGQGEIELLTPFAITKFSRQQMKAFSDWQFEMFSGTQIGALTPDQIKGLRIAHIDENWLNLLPLDALRPKQVEDLIDNDMLDLVDGEGVKELMKIRGLKPETRSLIEAYARSLGVE